MPLFGSSFKMPLGELPVCSCFSVEIYIRKFPEYGFCFFSVFQSKRKA